MTPEQIGELIAALDLKDHDYVIDAVLLVRVKDFDSGAVGISMAATNDVDWVGQLGLIRGAEIITTRDLHKTTREDDD